MRLLAVRNKPKTFRQFQTLLLTNFKNFGIDAQGKPGWLQLIAEEEYETLRKPPGRLLIAEEEPANVSTAPDEEPNASAASDDEPNASEPTDTFERKERMACSYENSSNAFHLRLPENLLSTRVR